MKTITLLVTVISLFLFAACAPESADYPRDVAHDPGSILDYDGDSVANNEDIFPEDPGEWADTDFDGVGDNGDNCKGLDNADQANMDGDDFGDVCDDDRDGDGTLNGDDSLPDDAAEWSDTDGVADASDNCPEINNSDQANMDGDDFGDVCDDDRDGDGTLNGDDSLPDDAAEWSDTDGVADATDNCLDLNNADQANLDGDALGDACDDDKDGDGSVESGDCDDTNLDVYLEVCGDGHICGDEICDTGALVSGDGCDDSCQVEDHWACSASGFGPSDCICTGNWDIASDCTACLPGLTGSECSALGYLVSPSNQTTCYDETSLLASCLGTVGLATCGTTDYCGQDAQYIDQARSYTVDDVSGEVIVTDSLTGLVWQQHFVKGKNWQGALDYCDGLTYGGENDWRLPNRFELHSLVDYDRHLPATDDTTAFPSTPDTSPNSFWTSSFSASHDVYAWRIGFDDGEVSYHDMNFSYAVRCVRLGPLAEEPERFVVTGTASNEVVTDRHTDYVWQKEHVADKTWKEALAYCESLDYAGVDDWRLPDVKELSSLVNVERYEPASDFPDMLNIRFWTSSSYAGSYDDAWSVKFDHGFVFGLDKTASADVRCVRLGP
ncbi:DUF1566 domain-containing protein [Myxococcota bacterium]|nr:DUF1566 domain-containing protein [Myxococcota bacterium]